MIRLCITLLITANTLIAATVLAPAAYAADIVVYEVLSSDFATVDVQYSDLSGQNSQAQVRLPWRINATVANARSNDTQILASWPPSNSKWVTARIYFHGSLYCQRTRDEGNASCFGDTIFR